MPIDCGHNIKKTKQKFPIILRIANPEPLLFLLQRKIMEVSNKLVTIFGRKLKTLKSLHLPNLHPIINKLTNHNQANIIIQSIYRHVGSLDNIRQYLQSSRKDVLS